MSVERYEEHNRAASPTDRLLSSVTGFISAQPLVAGVVFGLFLGGLTNSGLVFFLTVACIAGLGAHLSSVRNA